MEIKRYNGDLARFISPLAVLALNYMRKANLKLLIKSLEIFETKCFIIAGKFLKIDIKSSLGAVQLIDLKRFENFEKIYKFLKKKEFKIISIEISKKTKSMNKDKRILKKYKKSLRNARKAILEVKNRNYRI